MKLPKKNSNELLQALSNPDKEQ